ASELAAGSGRFAQPVPANAGARRDWLAGVRGVGIRAVKHSVGSRIFAVFGYQGRSRPPRLLRQPQFASSARQRRPRASPSTFAPEPAMNDSASSSEPNADIAVPAKSPEHPAPSTSFWKLTLGSIGVVYGDIGTSP